MVFFDLKTEMENEQSHVVFIVRMGLGVALSLSFGKAKKVKTLLFQKERKVK